MTMNMTCSTIIKALLAFPDWVNAFVILFVAACFGASIAVMFYEVRYRDGIDYQKQRRQ